MVLLSVVFLALSTDSRFYRPMTDCERLAYVEAAEPGHLEAAYMLLGEPNCTNIDLSYQDGVNDDLSHSVDDSNRTGFYIPSYFVPKFYFRVIEAIALIFFTIDFALRVSCCPSLIRYCKSIINVLDAAALLGAYIYVIIIHADPMEQFEHTSVWVFSHMQVLRVLRLLRIARPLFLYKVLSFSLMKIFCDLSIVILLLFAGVCTFTSFVFICEANTNYTHFMSIPDGWWWAVITMTTVGYGDMRPVTEWGKVVASLCAFSGVIIFSLTILIFVYNFLTFSKYHFLIVHGRYDTPAAKWNRKEQTYGFSEGRPEGQRVEENESGV